MNGIEVFNQHILNILHLHMMMNNLEKLQVNIPYINATGLKVYIMH